MFEHGAQTETEKMSPAIMLRCHNACLAVRMGPLPIKDVLRFSTRDSGALCAMISDLGHERCHCE